MLRLRSRSGHDANPPESELATEAHILKALMPDAAMASPLNDIRNAGDIKRFRP